MLHSSGGSLGSGTNSKDQKAQAPRFPCCGLLSACAVVRRSCEERMIFRARQPPPESQVVHTQSVGHSGKSPSVSLSSEYRWFQVTFRAFAFRQHSLRLKCILSPNRLEKARGPNYLCDFHPIMIRRAICEAQIPVPLKLSPHVTAHWFHFVSEN